MTAFLCYSNNFSLNQLLLKSVITDVLEYKAEYVYVHICIYTNSILTQSVITNSSLADIAPDF